MEKQALYIVKTLQTAGFQAVYAGGVVRDMIMNVPCNDIDVATSAKPEEIEKLFDKCILTGKNFGVINVVIDNKEIEVATFRSDSKTGDGRRPDSISFCSMQEDAQRRDFTINGIFFDPISKIFYDYINGREDIKNGIVKFIGNPEERINEDKLRMIRFIRFSARFGTCDKASFEAVQNNAYKINTVSAERIQEEIIKMLKIGQPRKVFDLLMTSGIMHEILPEVEKLKDTVQDKQWHPEGNVDQHCKLVMENLVGEDVILQLAGMFHDIGKPVTTKIEGERVSSKEHAKYGADITREVFKRLKFSNDITDLVCKLVYDHMKIIDVPKMSKAKQKRFFAEDHFNMLLRLHEADRNGGCNRTDTLEAVKALIEQYASEPVKPAYFVTGKDLIDLGMKAGKDIGKVKEFIYDQQLEGQFSNRDEALIFAKAYLKYR
jgi:poly(A) polymerase